MKPMIGRISCGRGLGGGTKYFRVEVHPDAKSMRRSICENDRWIRRRIGPCAHGHARTAAMCRYYGSWWERRHNTVGTLYFHRNCFGAGVVAHECTHAALYFIKPHNEPFTFTRAMDERLAMQVHTLVRRFWRWWYSRNPGQEPRQRVP